MNPTHIDRKKINRVLYLIFIKINIYYGKNYGRENKLDQNYVKHYVRRF
jgi:hypothetical protein